MDPIDQVDLVKRYLRGQNLEQLGRVDEAIAEYEAAVAEAFDSPGPYDRLIALYGAKRQHQEVIRVADSAVAQVHTYDAKRDWYRKVRDEAAQAATSVPRSVPRAVPPRS